MVNKDKIVRFFRFNKRPISLRELSQKMGLDKKDSRALKRLLREMLKSGEIIRTRKGLYGPATEMSLVSGYFEAHKDGYGFVISEKPGERDIFIPARKTSGAMDNDSIIARIENYRRREGRIIRILERAHNRLVGKLDYVGNAYYLHPKQKRIPFDVFIPKKESQDARDGDTVVAEITEFSTAQRAPIGRVIKKIERPDEPKAEIKSIIEEFNLPGRFPSAVSQEIKNLPEKAAGEMLKGRKDLRPFNTITIDGERAKDFDDAISVQLTEHGYKLYVHVADVGYFVPWDSKTDLEAKKRGTSVYFPDRVIPMLPKKLSEDLCSLKPGVERIAFTVEMDFTRDGEKVRSTFYPSVIKSNERMTYTHVKKILIDGDETLKKRYDYLLDDLELMRELCSILREKRMERGSLDFDLPEPEVLLDLKGNPEAIIRAERNFAHTMIEEFMITANESVADYIQSLQIPGLYRIHEEPDETKMEEITRVLRCVAHTRKRKLTPADFPKIMKKIHATPYEEVINYLILRSLKQAKYSTINVGHFGLASINYTHFTSPIRRYPDLVVHRILREALTKKGLSERRMKTLEKTLPPIAFHSSRRERVADEAEREVIDALRAWLMKDKVGEEFEGKIVGITPQRLKIRLDEYYIDGFLHVSYMTDDFYVYDENNLTLKGKTKKRLYSMGDKLVARIDRVDMEEREILFSISTM